MYQTDQNRPRYMHVPNKVIWMLGWLPCTYRTHPDLVSSPPYFWMQARDHKMNARIKNCFLSFSLRFCRPTCLFLSTGKQILAKHGPVSRFVKEMNCEALYLMSSSKQIINSSVQFKSFYCLSTYPLRTHTGITLHFIVTNPQWDNLIINKWIFGQIGEKDKQEMCRNYNEWYAK